MINDSKTVFKCGYINCNKQFDTLFELKTHLKKRHPNDKSKTVFKCGYHNCNKYFDTKLELEKHLQTHKTVFYKHNRSQKRRSIAPRIKNNKLILTIIGLLVLFGEYYFNLTSLFAITIGIIAFVLSILVLVRIFKWGNRLRMKSDLEIFLTRIFSAIFAPVAFIVTFWGGFALPGLLTYYIFSSAKIANQVLTYLVGGLDVFISVFLITFGFGLAVFSAFMFFRFMRRLGTILWIK
jgi:hypothetical protein